MAGLDSLREAARSGKIARMEARLASLSPDDLVHELANLAATEQAQVLAALPPGDAGRLIDHMPVAQAAQALRELAPEDAAAILDALPGRDRADLLTHVPHRRARAILDQMYAPAAAEARRLGQYKPNEAGGIMTGEFLACRDSATIGEVSAAVRASAPELSDSSVQYVYCVSDFNDLVGVLRLRDLVMRPHSTLVSDVMIRQPRAINVHARLNRVIEEFEQSRFIGLPVVNQGMQLVGVIRRADVESAMARQAQSDIMKMLGIMGGEELRSMPMIRRAQRRLAWLTLNIGLNVVAASAIAMFQDTLAQVIALAVFLPIISDMSGCSGNQAVAVSLREMALGLTRFTDMAKVLAMEASLGILNGIVLGLMIAGITILWKGNPWLGFVTGTAMAVNTVVAAVVGGLLPLVLKRLRMDPALSAAPILTTVTDFCGFFSVLALASVMLKRLV